MYGATVVFHLASIVFILVLLYRMLAWKKRNQRLLELLASGWAWQSPKVVIEQPSTYLREVCEALGIPFAMGGRATKTGPAKVSPKGLMALAAAVAITEVQLGVDQEGLDIFYGSSGKALPDMQSLPKPEELARELGVPSVRYYPEAS